VPPATTMFYRLGLFWADASLLCVAGHAGSTVGLGQRWLVSMISILVGKYCQLTCTCHTSMGCAVLCCAT
jgi:hypothetical protein